MERTKSVIVMQLLSADSRHQITTAKTHKHISLR